MKRLGKNWKRLHRLVYLAGVLAVVHFVWLVKSDVREPLAYGAVVLLLLTLRLTKVKNAAKSLRDSFPAGRRGYRSIAAPGDPI